MIPRGFPPRRPRIRENVNEAIRAREVRAVFPDGTVEVHIVSFASDVDFQNYRKDPRRLAHAWLLEKSSARLELLPMANVSG